MKKAFQTLMSALMAFLAISGCVKEKDTLAGVPVVTIRAVCEGDGDEAAKASFVPDGSTFHLAWQGTDNIRVYNHDDNSQNAVYEIQPGFTPSIAHFAGPDVNGSSFDIVAPGTYESIEDAANGNPDLTQNGNNNADHLVFTALLQNVSRADRDNIFFNSSWAESHGATLKRGAVIKFVVTLPDVITAPRRIVLEEFNSVMLEHPISVNLTNISTTSEHVLTAYAQAGWEDMAFAAGKYFTIGVMDADGTYRTIRHRITSKKTLKAGSVNRLTTTATATAASGTDKWIEQLFAGGDGTQGNPYLLATPKHLDNIRKVLAHQEKKYFRVIKDIDMQDYLASNPWVPLNWESPYDCPVNLDGGGYTIDHFKCHMLFSEHASGTVKEDSAVKVVYIDGTWNKPAFFGLLYGEVYNLNFTNADIYNECGTATGILAGYAGYNAFKATIQNVHVHGNVKMIRKPSGVSENITDSSDNSGVGGLAGRVDYAFIDSCSADCAVLSQHRMVGGLFGCDWGSASTIRNCYTKGSVTSYFWVGGIFGALIRPNTTIINCYSVAAVEGNYGMGGIGGGANLDKYSVDTAAPEHFLNSQPNNTIQGCIAWNIKDKSEKSKYNPFDNRVGIKSTRTDSSNNHYSSGGIIGYTSAHNNLTDCKRRSDMLFVDYKTDWTLYDQENASTTSALTYSITPASTYQYYTPYHGKSVSGTIASVAQSLGWSTDVWDFSDVNEPKLTGVVEATPAQEIPESGDPEVPAGTDMHREPYLSASKNGLGLDWTEETIATGIKYYHTSGKCTAGWMDSGTRQQEAFVIDCDLSSPTFDVKIVGTSEGVTASQVGNRVNNAIAVINGAYEIGSIALKANLYYNVEKNTVTSYTSGFPMSYMPNNTIGSTGVYNWKSEGTFYCDGHRGARIAFDGYDGYTGSSIGGNTGTNVKVRTVQQERLFYQFRTDDEAGFISSAPILDANYIRFGQSWKDRMHNASGNSEEPVAHQGEPCPRTAVAITYPDGVTPHLLLIVVDGRYADGYGGYGFSAYWLERFIANAFGPKYMLNLDGGGSTTMWIKDKGVVNYPCDNRGSNNRTHNHEGERSRDSFICIVPANQTNF